MTLQFYKTNTRAHYNYRRANNNIQIETISIMSAEHWQTFQKQQSQSFRYGLGDSCNMPVDANELERLRRKQSGLCSVKSLFCCISVLVGRPLTTTTTAKSSSKTKNTSTSRRRRRRLQQQKQQQVVRFYEKDDDSFGDNFDEQMSPRVMTRLATSSGHNFN